MSRRSLSTEERKLLAVHSQSPAKDFIRSFAFGIFFISGVGFVVLFALWKWLAPSLGILNAKDHALYIAIFSVSGSLLYLLPHMRSAWNFNKKYSDNHASPLQQDLRDDVVECVELIVTATYELPEFEDEGVGFFMVLADQRVLYVQGQDLYDFAHDAVDEDGNPTPHEQFPSDRIRYSYAPRSGIRLGLLPTRNRQSAILLAPLTYKKDREYPEDGTFYEDGWAAVMNRFELILAK